MVRRDTLERQADPVLGFRVQGSGFRVQGAGFRVQGAGFKVRVQVRFKVWCQRRSVKG